MSSQILQPDKGAFFKEPRQFPKRFPNGFPHGPRTERRAKENAKLRQKDIRYCEIRLSPNCSRTYGLGWAHSKKSRFLTTDADWQEAARSCHACHAIIEAMDHATMKKYVREAIARRKQ